MLGQSSVYTVPGVHAASGQTVRGGASEAPSKWPGSNGLGGRARARLSPEFHVNIPCYFKMPSDVGFGFCSSGFAKCG